MRGDVLPRRLGPVVAQAMSDRVDPAESALGPPDIAERYGVRRKELEHLDRIGARPLAERPCLVPADRTGGGEPYQRKPARQAHDRLRAPAVKAQPALFPVRQNRLDPPDGQPPI